MLYGIINGSYLLISKKAFFDKSESSKLIGYWCFLCLHACCFFILWDIDQIHSSLLINIFNMSLRTKELSLFLKMWCYLKVNIKTLFIFICWNIIMDSCELSYDVIIFKYVLRERLLLWMNMVEIIYVSKKRKCLICKSGGYQNIHLESNLILGSWMSWKMMMGSLWNYREMGSWMECKGMIRSIWKYREMVLINDRMRLEDLGNLILIHFIYFFFMLWIAFLT